MYSAKHKFLFIHPPRTGGTSIEVALASYADDVVEAFVERAAENGIDVFRIFDAMNDLRNFETSIKAALANGKHAQGKRDICGRWNGPALHGHRIAPVYIGVDGGRNGHAGV